MSYEKLIRFGTSAANSLPVYDNDPLTYCVGNTASQRFNHGSNADIYGQNSNPCQVYMAQRCAKDWDDVCEYASSHQANDEYKTRADTMGAGMRDTINLTPGDILLRNTAQEKFRSNMTNCQLRTEPFDPLNPSSPMITYNVGRYCVPEYKVDPTTIEGDVVMHKILDNPKIAMQMLLNIKNTMIREGTFAKLAGTRLGAFYGIGLGRNGGAAGSRREDFGLVPLGYLGDYPIDYASVWPWPYGRNHGWRRWAWRR